MSAVGRNEPFATHFRNPRRRNMSNIALTGQESIDLALIDVKPHGLEAAANEGANQGQPDIAQPNYPHHRRLVTNCLF